MKLIAWAAAAALAQTAADPAAGSAAKGAPLFDQFCAQCHGVKMVSPGTAAFDLRTFPSDQHDRFVESVTHGKNAMPPWEGVLSAAEIEDLWAYVRTHGAPTP